MKLDAEQIAHDAIRCLEVVGGGEGKIMPQSKLHDAAGFVLLTSKKAALVAGVETGHGILVAARGVDAEGHKIYSPPLPVETTRLGVGFSIGYEKLYSIMLLRSPTAVVQAASGGVVGGGDIELPGYARDVHEADKVRVHRTVKLGDFNASDLVDRAPGDNVADVYAASKGIMIADISYSGGTMRPSDGLIKVCYGEGVTANDILHAKVEAPKEFAELYSFLSRLEVKIARVSQVVSVTLSQPEAGQLAV